ncbi:alpha-glucosidase [Klebsiella huaxiensis]|uniref:Alpha-amylase n=1 Tax=Klebsiella huaxiensis TaxID=2153354 RepID=A0ABT6EFQ9_9ENTR|nr:alpha-glucosidase [Klebsiella huaxiensis]MDG1643681.1 alpha-glucosidase [Klebsiella huaxiensis]QBG08016.1 alpha-glucosidase [Klebsiella huaxiensis]VUT06188.1 Oligo-1,6-glucosidase [Klebsiella huaxiensis]
MNQPQQTAWWKESVIYQVYPKSFYDSNNDGIGDIKGIIAKLPYLKKLGITMIWVSPFYQSPMADNGYDIADYYAVNPDLGQMQDVDDLIKQASEMGIQVMIDLVVNHTSDEHPWFQAALADPHSKYRDYYIFKPAVAGGAPNNWRSIFGGSAWEKVAGEETWYLHVFHKKQPDLNWENPQLREEIYSMVNWWLDKGIAGFRIDAITFIKKDQDYGSLPADGVDGLASIKSKSRNRPGIELFLNELKEKTFNRHRCVTVGEAPGVPLDEYDSYIGPNGYFDMIFDFHAADIDVENGSEWFKQRDWRICEFREALFASQRAFCQTGWGTTFIENHDQPRALSKLIRDVEYQNAIGAKALAGMYFFMQGTPFIYQGQELGMKNFQRTSIDEFDDISSLDNYHRSLAEGFTGEQALGFINQRSRDNSRTPFPWSDGVNAGFNLGAKPWLPFSAPDFSVNAQSQAADEHSVFSFYQTMIDLRNKRYPQALIYGSFAPIENVDDRIVAYERKTDTQRFVSITNLSAQHLPFTFPAGEVLLNNYADIGATLQPYQTILVKE